MKKTFLTTCMASLFLAATAQCVGDTTLYGAIHGVSVRALLAQTTCLQTREPRA